MDIIKNPGVQEVFDSYPESLRRKLLVLRRLILETAREIEGIEEIQETLKWGEPSYLVKGGSTVRIAARDSQYYAVYFHCRTMLVDTFRELYPETFRFEGNRAIVFHKDDPIPKKTLKHCIELSLCYHGRKHLPMLGVTERVEEEND